MQKINNWEWIDLAETGSTNDEALHLTSGAKGHKYIVTAQKQNSGRGRRGRGWVGLEGNLFMSMAVEMEPCKWGQAVFVVSLSLLETVRTLFPTVDIKLKWPNDVLVAGRKISGILLEKGEGGYLVIGIGVNIKKAPQIEGVIYPAVSLAELGYETDRITFLKKYMDIFDKNVNGWNTCGFGTIRQRWLADVKGLGCEIRVRTDKEEKDGIFEGVDENGLLLLKTNDKTEKIYAGDVFFPR